MEAIKAHDADLAEKLAHQHMINAYDNMVKNGLHEAYEKEKNYGQKRTYAALQYIIIQQTRSIIRRYYIYNYYGMLLEIYRKQRSKREK